MSGATTAAWVSAAIAAASAATSAVQQNSAQHRQERSARDQLAAQEKAQALQDEQLNKATGRKANIEGLLEGNNIGDPTMLTGAQGQAIGDTRKTLGSQGLLGG